MTDKGGFEHQPPNTEANIGFSGQYGADSRTDYPNGSAYYTPSAGVLSPAGGAHPAQPGYGQPYPQFSGTAVVVTQPGTSRRVVAQPQPPDYMIHSIFACLCCFWPTGIFAIYFASRAKTLAAEGDIEGATRMSNNARNLLIASIALGLIWIAVVIALRFAVYPSTSRTYRYSN